MFFSNLEKEEITFNIIALPDLVWPVTATNSSGSLDIIGESFKNLMYLLYIEIIYTLIIIIAI